VEKKSIEEVKKLFIEGGVEPLFEEYISANTPLKFRCVCGNIEMISITSLKRSLKTLNNVRCKKCRFNKISQDKNNKTKNLIIDKFNKINIIHVIPGEHEKFPPKIIFDCPMCGSKDSLFYNKKLEFLLCKKCSKDFIVEKQRLTQEEVKELFKKENAILISDYKNTNQKLTFKCSCGELGSILLTNLKYKGVKPLCKKCQLKYSYPKGRESPNWNSNLTEENRISWGRNNEDKQWYRRIFEKFGYTCFISGKRNIPLSAHHLFQYSKYPDLRLNLDNGICIDRDLHYEFHKRYSYLDTSIENFCEFFYEKTGIKFEEYYDILNKKWKESEMRVFTIKEAKEFIKKCGAEPLFEEYFNNYSDYLVRCSCGNEEKIKFSTLGRNLKKNLEYKYKCSKCRNNGNPIHSIKSLKRDFIEYRAEPLFEEYISLRSPLKYRCSCGKISSTTCEQFYTRIKIQEGYKFLCQSCACKESKKDINKQFFEENIKPFFEKNNIELLSKEYKNNHTHLRFKCSCGNETQVFWGSLKNNKCFKCKSCQIKDIPRGKNHSDWNFNLTQEDRNKTRYGRGNLEKIWESFILNLSDYVCIISGQKGGKLSAHHLNSWAKNPLERYYLSNGVCISKELHKEFHDLYGMKKGDNTLEQFQEFYKKKTNQEFNLEIPVFDFIEETPSSISLLEKKKSFNKEGKKYIPFFIPELNSKRDIVLSMIRFRCGKIRNKIYARNLKIKEISDFDKVQSFLNENHIQGGFISSINLALVDTEGEIISLMTFNKKEQENREFILQRFCSKININVPGGASKLFKYFIRKFNPNKITTYGDIRFSDLIPNENSMYIKLGFKYDHSSKPNYWYTKDNVNLIFRRKFQKSNLSRVLGKEIDLSLTEREIMISEGYQRKKYLEKRFNL
jgi:hypothetical protein